MVNCINLRCGWAGKRSTICNSIMANFSFICSSVHLHNVIQVPILLRKEVLTLRMVIFFISINQRFEKRYFLSLQIWLLKLIWFIVRRFFFFLILNFGLICWCANFAVVCEILIKFWLVCEFAWKFDPIGWCANSHTGVRKKKTVDNLDNT